MEQKDKDLLLRDLCTRVPYGVKIHAKDIDINTNVEVEKDGELSMVDGDGVIAFTCDDNWELVHNKFDITTLKPYDKVLTRANDDDSWVCNLYSHRIQNYFVVLNAELAPQCIPYEENKHLLNTTNDCNDYYKTWEE